MFLCIRVFNRNGMKGPWQKLIVLRSCEFGRVLTHPRIAIQA